MQLYYSNKDRQFSGRVSRYTIRQVFSNLQYEAAVLSELKNWKEAKYYVQQMEDLRPILSAAHDYSASGYDLVEFTD